MFLLKVICCIGGAIVAAGGVTGFEKWIESRPLVEEKDSPLYIVKDLSDYL